MKEFLFSLILMGVCASASAMPVTFVDAGSEWNYTDVGFDLWPGWSGVDYSTYDFSSASWSTGNAAFGNTSTYTTYWTANTDIALEQSFAVNGSASDLILNVASDNGFVIFLNGVQIAKQNAEGFTHYWEYSFSLSPSLLVQGENIIQVLAEDHGGATFFDMELLSNDVIVSEAASFLLMVSSLLLVGFVRRKV